MFPWQDTRMPRASGLTLFTLEATDVKRFHPQGELFEDSQEDS